MKFWKIFLLSCFISVSSSMASENLQKDLPYNLKVNTLGNGAYVITDKDFYDSNTLVVMMPDQSAVIVSSPFENLGTTSMVQWIKTTLKPKKIVAINTHYHLDGTGGNEIFKKEGIETWSSDLTKNLRLEDNKKDRVKSAEFYKKEELRQRILQSNPIAADHVFELKSGKRFAFSGEEVEVFFPGPAHSPDNVVVYFPRKKILFGGCMIKPEELGYLGAADVKAWPDSARQLLKFDAELVIPGHGAWGSRGLIDKTIKVAEKAKSQIKSERTQGKL